MIHKLDFYTSYHQFYLEDKELAVDTSDDEFWSEAAYHSRLAVGEGVRIQIWKEQF